MQIPPDPFPDLLHRMTQRLQEEKVDNQILEILQQAFDTIFDQNHILLSRPERIRLFRQASKSVLTDVLEKLDRDS